MLVSSISQYALQNVGKNVMVKKNTKHKKLLEEIIYYGKLVSVKSKDNNTVLNMNVIFTIIIYSKMSMKMHPYKVSIFVKEKEMTIDSFTSINEKFDLFNINNYLNFLVKEFNNPINIL